MATKKKTKRLKPPPGMKFVKRRSAVEMGLEDLEMDILSTEDAFNHGACVPALKAMANAHVSLGHVEAERKLSRVQEEKFDLLNVTLGRLSTRVIQQCARQRQPGLVVDRPIDTSGTFPIFPTIGPVNGWKK